jgi:tRNA-2-methylthio-N6-dimethylallyladenosine synthase
MSAKSVFIQTFGCQMNKLDSEIITGSLLSVGYQPAQSESDADVILVNTCSVRKHAEERVYSRVSNLKHLKKKKPNLIIGIIGCMAQKDKERLFERLPHISLVCGPHRYKSIVGLIERIITNGSDRIVCADEEGLLKTEKYSHETYLADNKSAYVQIMRGCDNFCSYCIVPYVRGREISRQPEEIIPEVSSLLDKGVKEITLLGQNVTSYGKSLGDKVTLSSLLKELGRVQKVQGFKKFKGSKGLVISFFTSHPANVTDELLETMAALPEVKKTLHMPAQSGSNRILKMMNRGYTRKEYLEIVHKAKELMPDIKIVSDFIVGFPTETDEDFQDTVSLVKEARFSKIYVFKYSPRKGTSAEKLSDDVPMETKKYRNNCLLEKFKS